MTEDIRHECEQYIKQLIERTKQMPDDRTIRITKLPEIYYGRDRWRLVYRNMYIMLHEVAGYGRFDIYYVTSPAHAPVEERSTCVNAPRVAGFLSAQIKAIERIDEYLDGKPNA
jgi:hypothetical protein